MTKTLILMCVGAFLLAGCATTQTAWEYRSLQTYANQNLDQKLNELAKEGWKVVSSSTSQNQGEALFAVVILKRPRR